MKTLLTAAQKYEHDNEHRLPFFWLGSDAGRVQWYQDNYTGIARKMHLAGLK